MTERCHRCGRATAGGTRYVYGIICNRAECQRVKEGLNNRFEMFWFTACLPDGEGFMGRPASFDVNGEPNNGVGIP